MQNVKNQQSNAEKELRCSVCTLPNTSKKVKVLLRQDNIYLCDGCVQICNEILEEEKESELSKAVAYRKSSYYCSFCKRNSSGAKRLISMTSNIYICNFCVDICNQRIEENMKEENMTIIGRIAKDKEEGGELVRKAWIRWAIAQQNPKPSWLVAYKDLDESDKEADRTIWQYITEPYDELIALLLEDLRLDSDEEQPPPFTDADSANRYIENKRKAKILADLNSDLRKARPDFKIAVLGAKYSPVNVTYKDGQYTISLYRPLTQGGIELPIDEEYVNDLFHQVNTYLQEKKEDG